MVLDLFQFLSFAVYPGLLPPSAGADGLQWGFLSFSSLQLNVATFWLTMALALLWLGVAPILLYAQLYPKKGLRYLNSLPGGEAMIVTLSGSMFLFIIVNLIKWLHCKSSEEGVPYLVLATHETVVCWEGWHLLYACLDIVVLVPYLILATTLGTDFMVSLSLLT